MKLFIIMACILAVTVADHGKKAKENSKNSICSKKLSVKPEDCCPNMPSFQQYFAPCAVQCNVTLSSNNSPASGKQGTKDKNGKGSDSKKNFDCIMPCILKSANVLGTDGNISSSALNAALLKGAAADWTQIVPNVTSVCIANATKMMNSNKTFDKSSEEKDSKNGTHHGPCFNGMVVSCVFKNLYLSCPSKILSTNSSCADLTAKMTKCEAENGGKHGKRGGSDESGENSGEKGGRGAQKGKNKKNQESKGKKGKGEQNGKQDAKKDNKGKDKAASTTQAPASQAPTTKSSATQAPTTAKAIGK